MKTYKFIPYDKSLVSRARELRKSETETEKKFWSEILKNKKLSKYKFTRQKPIGDFIIDFYCAKFKLGVEIDGDIHKFKHIRDFERDNLLKQEFGLRIIRYKNQEVLNNINKVIDDLVEILISFPPDKGD